MSFNNIPSATNGYISDSRSYLDNMVNVKVAPSNAKGLSGWEFSIPKETALKIEADVTDHVTENGSFLNDHIVIKPIEISLTGYIGELVFTKPRGINRLQNQISSGLEMLDSFFGDYTPAQKIQITAFSNIQKVNSEINKNVSTAQNIINMFSGETGIQTKQQKAYQELSSLMYQKQKVSIVTPYGYFDDFVIKSVNLTQGEETEHISDVSITLKQVRFTDTQIIKYDNDLFPPREEVQKTETKDTGTGTGTKQENSSIFYKGYQAVKGQ